MLQYILLILIIIVLCVVRSMTKPKDFPPGPRWYPFFGCSSEIYTLTKKHGSRYKAYLELSKQYSTEVLGLNLDGERMVIFFGENKMKDTLNAEQFDGRPDNFFTRMRCFGRRAGISLVDGSIWKIHRKFTLTHLRNAGYGKGPMEKDIQNALFDLVKWITEQSESPICPKDFLPLPIVNVLWRCAAGSEIEPERWNYIQGLIEKRGQIFSHSGGLLNRAPWIRFFLPRYTGYSMLMKMNKQIYGIIAMRVTLPEVFGINNRYTYIHIFVTHGVVTNDRSGNHVHSLTDAKVTPKASQCTFSTCLYNITEETIQKHKNGEVEDNDFINAFLHEMANNRDTFTEEQLQVVCLDLILAGSGTTAHAMEFAILQVLRDQEMQKKIQKEIDQELGDNVPCWNDNIRLIYTSAFLLELLRFYTIIPTAGPRRVLKETIVDGYVLPKNTTVLMSLGDIHVDPDLWADPEVFKPERFINNNGTVKQPEHYYPFGLGRRRCPADTLARMFLLITFTGLMQQFSITCADDNLPSNEPDIGMLLASAKRFNAVFKARKPKTST